MPIIARLLQDVFFDAAAEAEAPPDIAAAASSIRHIAIFAELVTRLATCREITPTPDFRRHSRAMPPSQYTAAAAFRAADISDCFLSILPPLPRHITPDTPASFSAELHLLPPADRRVTPASHD